MMREADSVATSFAIAASDRVAPPPTSRIQAARAVVTGPDLDDTAQMRTFWRDGAPPLVANAQRVGFHRKEGRWECAATLEGPIAAKLRR